MRVGGQGSAAEADRRFEHAVPFDEAPAMGSEKGGSLGRPELEGNADRVRVRPGRAVHVIQHCWRDDLENPALEVAVFGQLAR